MNVGRLVLKRNPEDYSAQVGQAAFSPGNHRAQEACPSRKYWRDGSMRFGNKSGGGPNFWPNSFGEPKEDPTYAEPALKIAGDADRYEQKRGVDEDYVQPGNLYRSMPPDEQK